MMSLFSSFDLAIFAYIFTAMILFSLLLLSKTFKISLSFSTLEIFKNFMHHFFDSIKVGSNKISISLNLTLMVLLLILNFSSVLGYTFPLTSQISVIFFMGLSIWVTYIIFKFAANLKGFILHCIPESCPMLLSNFLFVIELISNVIRPITMSVRLTANILAGHLLMILLSKIVLVHSSTFLSYLILNFVEMCVALIQAYIFVTMSWLFYSEV